MPRRRFRTLLSFLAPALLLVTAAVLGGCLLRPGDGQGGPAGAPSGAPGPAPETAPGPARPVTRPVTILVCAAASLQEALEAAAAEFSRERPEIRVQFSFGSSGALARQILAGAPADLFIAAGEPPMEWLIREGLVDPAAVRSLAGNQVVLIVPREGAAGAGPAEGATGAGLPGGRPGAGSPGGGPGPGAPPLVRGWEDLRDERVRPVAMGDPAHVPAGEYGKQVLEHLGLWEAVAPRLVLDPDVRAVLYHVAAGAARAGIVYRTDAAGSDQVQIVAHAPPGSHRPVVYPLAVLPGSRHRAAAEAFASFLFSDRGQALFQQHGFLPGK